MTWQPPVVQLHLKHKSLNCSPHLILSLIQSPAQTLTHLSTCLKAGMNGLSLKLKFGTLQVLMIILISIMLQLCTHVTGTLLVLEFLANCVYLAT